MHSVLTSIRDRRWSVLLLLGISLSSFFYTTRHLDADPVKLPFFSNADEATYSRSAREFRLHGTWLASSFNPLWTGPLFPPLQWAASKLIDRPISRYRVISALAVACLPVLIFVHLLRGMRRPERFWLAAYAGFSFILVIHARMGIPEATQTCLLTIAVLAMRQSLLKNSPLLAFVSMLLGVATASVKISGLIAVPILLVGPMVAFFLASRENRSHAGVLAGAALAGGIVGLLIYGLCVGRHVQEWYAMNHFMVMGGAMHSPWTAPRGFWRAAHFLFSLTWKTMPFLCVLSCFWLYRFFRNALPERRTADHALLAAWLILPALFLSQMDYQPIRWQILCVPPIVVCAGLGVSMIHRWRSVCVVVALAWGYSVLASHVQAGRWVVAGWSSALFGLASVPVTVCGVALLTILYAVLRKSPRGPATAVLILAFVFQLYLNRSIFQNYQFTLRDACQIVSQQVGSAAISGDGETNFGLGLDQIQVIARYQLNNQETDLAFKQLFDHAGYPSYYSIVDWKIPSFAQRAPRLASCLSPLQSFQFDIGSPVLSTFTLFRVDTTRLLREYQ